MKIQRQFMKTFKFLLLVVGLCNIAISFAQQTEFAPAGAEWYYTYTFGCCPESHFNHIVSEKDTIVEETSCRVLRKYYDISNVANETYIIKQEQGKIYYYYQNQFNLLFDFDAEVNDIVEFTFIYKKYADFLPSHKDTILSARFKIENITTNVQNLRTFRTKILDEDIPKFQLWDAPHTYIYTEKIGWHSEFMPMLDNAAHPDEEVFRWLRCYSETGFSFVSEEWVATTLPCNSTTVTSINIPQKENSIIYPNPVNDNVFVFTNEGGNIEIIDVSGKIVHNSELLKGINRLSTNQLHKGLFVVKIRYKDNSTQILKIIKS
jgi:hypothetical protein